MVTKKYIFQCKLKGLPIKIDTVELQVAKVRKLLVEMGVWEIDKAMTDKFWAEFAYRFKYRVMTTDDDGEKNHFWPGDHTTICT